MDGIKFKRPPVGAKHTSTREACRASLARQEHGHRLFDEPQRNVTIRSRSVREPLTQSVGGFMVRMGVDLLFDRDFSGLQGRKVLGLTISGPRNQNKSRASEAKLGSPWRLDSARIQQELAQPTDSTAVE